MLCVMLFPILNVLYFMLILPEVCVAVFIIIKYLLYSKYLQFYNNMF